MWVYCVNVNRELADDEFRDLAGTLEPGVAERIARIAHRESAVRALLSDLLARSMLASHSAVSPSSLEFSVGQHGKPGLVSSRWQYNISHSGEWVVCGVSETQPVGVDVEHVREPNLRVARRYFHPRELERLMRQTETERAGTFFDIWTAKESFLKAVGIGISVALNSFWSDDETRTVSIDDPLPFARLGVDIESGWCFDLLPLDADYRLAACSQVREELRCVRLDVDELLRLWRSMITGNTQGVDLWRNTRMWS